MALGHRIQNCDIGTHCFPQSLSKHKSGYHFFGHKQILKCSLEKPCIKVFKFNIPPKFYLSLRIKPSHIPTRPRPGVVTIFQRIKFVSTRGRVISYISALWNTLEYFSFPLIGILGCSHLPFAGHQGFLTILKPVPSDKEHPMTTIDNDSAKI